MKTKFFFSLFLSFFLSSKGSLERRSFSREIGSYQLRFEPGKRGEFIFFNFFSLKRKRNIAMIGVIGVERNVIQDESCSLNANYDDDDDDDSLFNCLGVDCKLTPMKKVAGSFFGRTRM